MLLVAVLPALTSSRQMSDLLNDIKLPDDVPFVAVILAGEFPESSISGGGGYRVWQLYGNGPT